MKLVDILGPAVKIAGVSVALWPTVRKLVEVAEEVYPGSSRGAEKLAAVMAAIDVVVHIESALAGLLEGVPQEQFAKSVDTMVTRAVTQDIHSSLVLPIAKTPS